ncbi:PREDICTED: probable protein phosphatase 2C 51 [Nicotiana attenuata]|uniref:PPM-type phosphatase domain-containing protein n=1 Tax=Nicotiana attenuata TaxID=49451 RepID=A0A314KMM4_NICAT|nr:PREDICTED: probable protein phosphatase 2C 51 [Nicotiana attenuata]OIT30538.1 putative protein phosphatase 2c 51 [Nicotiana attenuata]
MARRRDVVRNSNKKQQVGSWKMMSIIICGIFIACFIGIFMNLKVPKPEEKIVPQKTKSIPTKNCHFASNKGRRAYQEDRITCDLDLKIPFFGHKEVIIGVVAVFDGHIGEYASELASKKILEKFKFHLKNYHGHEFMEFLKTSLVKTIEEIDAEFSKIAIEHELYSGSTAVVALIYNNHVLVANVGDSKAFICSQREELAGDLVKELTRDHNALRADERARIEASGGKFSRTMNDVPLLNGHFPMTRAIGDVPLKKYGIIATPEVTDWVNLSSKDEFLVVSSDGIFESLSPQKVCDFLNKVEDYSDPSILAKDLILKAFLEGSRDNLSVVLVPLRSSR